MKVSEVLEHITYSELNTCSAVTRYLDKDAAISESGYRQLLSYINLAVIALHRKFVLKTKVLTKDTYVDVPFIDIRDNSVGLLLDVMTSYGESLLFPTVEGTVYDITEVSKGTYLLAEPCDGQLMFVYTETPTKLENKTDDVDLPDMMMEALLLYVTYKGLSTMPSTTARVPLIQSESHFKRFIQECATLKEEGFDVVHSITSKNVTDKGFA